MSDKDLIKDFLRWMNADELFNMYSKQQEEKLKKQKI